MSLLIMPCKGDFSVEIERWRIKVGELPVHQNIPGLQFALKLADKDKKSSNFTVARGIISS
jgi:hypothetical protein